MMFNWSFLLKKKKYKKIFLNLLIHAINFFLLTNGLIKASNQKKNMQIISFRCKLNCLFRWFWIWFQLPRLYGGVGWLYFKYKINMWMFILIFFFLRKRIRLLHLISLYLQEECLKDSGESLSLTWILNK